MSHFAFQTSPLALYAEGIDTSDYVNNVAPLIREAVNEVGDLLDVGAGAGQLGSALHTHSRHWVAIEPDPYMCNRLSSSLLCTRIIAGGWHEVHHLIGRSFDTVLAANIGAPLTEAEAFLDRCRHWTRDAVIWVVPSQTGPSKLCLSGCLPEHLHEDHADSGYERVMRQLSEKDHPDHTIIVDWTFSYITPDVDAVSEHMADRLGWLSCDSRRSELSEHLHRNAEPIHDGYRLDVPKQSSIMIWKDQ